MTAPGLLPAALAALAALAAPAAPAAPAGAEGDSDAVAFTQLNLDVEGELLDTRFCDMDGDGRRDLVVAVLARRPGLAARREIRIHPMAADGTVPLEAGRVIAVPDDAIVWGCADVRAEPGRELLLMSRSGVHSLSPQVEGLRDNLRRLATRDLLYQVPSASSLASWSYSIARPGRLDLLLVPGAEGLSVWGPAERAEGRGDGYTPLAELGGPSVAPFSVKSPGAVQASTGGLRISIDSGRNRGLFLEDAPAAWAAMLQAELRIPAPALADVDGDGRQDILFLDDKTLRVHLAEDAGFGGAASRTETLPDWLDPGEGRLILNLRDLDRDGDVDVYARLAPRQDSLDKVNFTYFILLNDGRRLFPEQPHQVLRFEASGTESEVTDVDADGRPDLVVTKYELPSLAELAGGFRLTRSALIYLAGEGDEPFGRKPVLRDEQVFSIDSLQDALVKRQIAGDLSGDGIADLVEVDLTGRVVIRRITYEDSFFGDGEWRVEEAPWKRLDLGADLARLQLEDVNGDGLADLINPGKESLALVLSRRTEPGR